MAIAGEEGFLCYGSRYRYEPIDSHRTGRPVVQHRPRRNVFVVACIFFSAVAGIVALGLAASRGSRLPTQPDEVVVGSGGPTTLHVGSSEGTGARNSVEQERYHQHQIPAARIRSGPSLQVRVANHYQLGENASTDLSLYPWEHVAEPYRETLLELTSVPEGVQGGANIM